MLLQKFTRFTEWAVGPYAHSDICLGIHYREQAFTVARVEKKGDRYETTFLQDIPIDVSSETDDDNENGSNQTRALESLHRSLTTLAGDPLVSSVTHLPVVLALDGSLYHTQAHHSDFADPKQIEQTLRFDIEEDALLDSEAVFLCYQKLPTTGAGSDILVFSTPRDTVEQLASGFEQNQLDSLAMVPDVVGWLHYLTHREQLPPDESALVLGRSRDNLYLLITDQRHQPLQLRCFSCPGEEDLVRLVTSEVRRTLALLPGDTCPTQLLLHREGLPESFIKLLARDLDMPIGQLEETNILRAFAEGVALGWLNRQTTADFRSDGFLPRTLEKVQKKAWLSLSAMTTALFLVLLMVLNLHSSQHEQCITDANNEMLAVFQETYPNEKPPPFEKIRKSLSARLKNLKENNQVPSSQKLAESAGSTFYLLLESLDSLPPKFDLALDTVRVGNNTVDLSGTVANIEDQVKLDEAFNQNDRFIIDKWSLNIASTNRRTFNMSLRIKQDEPEAASGNRRRK